MTDEAIRTGKCRAPRTLWTKGTTRANRNKRERCRGERERTPG